METSIRQLGYGQILFAALLVAMIRLRPDVYFGNDGISEYALVPSTGPFFIAAFLSAALFMWIAADCLRSSLLGKVVRPVFRLSSLLTAGLVVFPAIGNGVIDHIHIGCAVALFTVESLLVLWLVLRTGANAVNVTLLVILIVAALVNLLTLLNILHCKTQAEVVFQLVFNLLLLRLLRISCAKRASET